MMVCDAFEGESDTGEEGRPFFAPTHLHHQLYFLRQAGAVRHRRKEEGPELKLFVFLGSPICGEKFAHGLSSCLKEERAEGRKAGGTKGMRKEGREDEERGRRVPSFHL